jgi:hypothetical protein
MLDHLSKQESIFFQEGTVFNLKTICTKVALQHANDRSPLVVAYGIKDRINFTGMVHFNLNKQVK